MHLPGRLRATTLGDLLGTLHRAEATGTLEIVEDRGRVHRVHVGRGLVTAVELEGTSSSLAEILRREGVADEDVLRRSLLRAMASQRLHGEVLVGEFHLSPDVVGAALRRQVLARLEAIEQIADARVSFRVAVRAPRGALTGTKRAESAATAPSWDAPLGAGEFLHGRRRARERAPQRASPSPGSSAWSVLGLPPGADAADVKRAYRRLARAVHPDLHPGASESERRSLEQRFSALTDAYRALVA